MITIQCNTARFRGRGTFTCRHCNRRMRLPDGLAAVLLALPASSLLIDAPSGVVLHDCATARDDSTWLDPDMLNQLLDAANQTHS